jgi:chromosome segregation ATPase
MSEDKRDYAADLAVCEAATEGPREVETQYMDEPGYEQYIKKQEIVAHADEETLYVIARINWCNPVEANAQVVALARTALPWYVRKVMELEDRLETAHKCVKLTTDQMNEADDEAIVGMQELCFENTDLKPRLCGALGTGEALNEQIDDLRTQLTKAQNRGDNHVETLRGIANMDPETEGDRMRLWARDSLSGCEPLESTLKNLSDERNDLRSQLAESQVREGALREALEVTEKALTYAGVGQKYPFERLRHIIEAYRSTCRGEDYWKYWTYVIEKLDEAQKTIKKALSTPAPVNLEAMRRVVDVAEKAAEEIENCYGRETDLSKEIRKALADLERGGVE